MTTASVPPRLPILVPADDPCLRRAADHVHVDDLPRLMILAITLQCGLDYLDGAAGLALPQMGVSLRGFAIHRSVTGWKDHLVCFNPGFTHLSGQKEWDTEGCLSLPGVTRRVYRSREVKLAYTDQNCRFHEHYLSGLAARVAQHEMDHLEGRLITDYLVPSTLPA